MSSSNDNIITRPDFHIIAEYVQHKDRVLDIGCGDGTLLESLEQQHDVSGHGLELRQSEVSAAVAKGLSVVQGNADEDLIHYPDHSFDVVISSKTLQATHSPKEVLRQILRIGKRSIVSIPNFGQWYNRFHLGVYGRMPVSKTLSYAWYETPNIHFCTVEDFIQLAEELGANISDIRYIGGTGARLFPNLCAELAVFVLE